MLHHCMTVLRMAYTDAETVEIFTSQMGDEGFNPVVSAGSSFFTDSCLSRRQVQIIADNINIIQIHLVVAGNGPYRFAAVFI